MGRKFTKDAAGATGQAILFFGFVIAAALSLAMIFAVMTVHISGVPGDLSHFLISTMLIAGCVSGPMAALAAQNQYHMARYQAELRSIASTDALTGLINRRTFEQFGSDEIERMKRIGYSSCVAIFDLDHFKVINDTYGHAFGDKMLKQVADAAERTMRTQFDRVSRWGGEEFVLLLSNVSPCEAERACERLRRAIEDIELKEEGKPVKITASFGIAPLSTQRGLEASLETADTMLYMAKNAGRNRIAWKPDKKAAA